MLSFKGRHFPKDLILMAVRWKLAYSLSYRNIEELLEERGADVDHSTGRWCTDGRWCMDRVRLQLPLTRSHSGGSHLFADRMRPGHRQQTIQYGHTDGNLSLLSRKTPGA